MGNTLKLVDDARSVICIIDMFNLDESQFDFPYD